MRNLKRTLSLALAAVMLLGMMVVGTSAASFPDVTSENNTEAIAVIKAVGIMEGNDKGEFEPAKAVTRNEMAVVMANMMDLKADDYAGACKFTDVPDWAKNFVAACNAYGIVTGTGATTYSGDETVTTTQAGLMMMKALGYFQNSQDFGEDWKLATVKKASQIELFKGISGGADAALTRNDVAQLALTSLKADKVDFTGDAGSNIKLPDGTSIVNGYVEKYEAITLTSEGANNYAGGGASAAGQGTKQLCEYLYGTKLKLNSSATDGMGRPAAAWTYKASSVGTFADEPDYTIYATPGKTLVEMIDKLSKDFKDANATVKANGTASTLGAAIKTGDFIELYMDADDANKVNVVSITNKTVAKLTGDAATKVDGDDTLVKVPGVTNLSAYNATYTTDNVSGYSDLKEDDIVLYYEDANKNIFIEKAESFAGTLTVTSGASGSYKMTVSGTTYNQSGVTNCLNSTGTAINPTSFYSDESTWYTDNAGNIVWISGQSSSELAYVVARGQDSSSGFGTIYKAKLLSMDGTVKAVTVDADPASLVGHFVKYTVDSDDEYTLTDATGWSTGVEGQEPTGDGSSFSVTRGTPTLVMNSTTMNTNASTVYMVREYGSSAAKDSYKLYTGYANVPSIPTTTAETTTMSASDAKYMVAYAGTNDFVKYVVIDIKASVSGTTSASDLFYVVDATVSTLYDADGACGYTVKAIKSGEEEIVDLAFAKDPSGSSDSNFNAGTAIAADKAYTVSSYNEDGQITSYSAALTEAGKYLVNTKTGKANDGTVTLNNIAYAYNEDTVVYYIDDDDNLSMMAASEIAKDINDPYVAVRASGTSTDFNYNTIDTLFIREKVVDATKPIITWAAAPSITKNSATAMGSSVDAQPANHTQTIEWYINDTKVTNGATSVTGVTSITNATTNNMTATFAPGTYTIKLKAINTSNGTTVDGNLVASAEKEYTVIVSE